MSALTQNS